MKSAPSVSDDADEKLNADGFAYVSMTTQSPPILLGNVPLKVPPRRPVAEVETTTPSISCCLVRIVTLLDDQAHAGVTSGRP